MGKCMKALSLVVLIAGCGSDDPVDGSLDPGSMATYVGEEPMHAATLKEDLYPGTLVRVIEDPGGVDPERQIGVRVVGGPGQAEVARRWLRPAPTPDR